MATTWPIQTNAMTGTSTQNAANTFIPIMWSDELLVTREANLVAAKLFKRVNHKGKPGDTIRVPFISDLSANTKNITQAVTIQAIAEGKIDILLDQHKEVSFLLEDFVKLQSRYDLRKPYVQKAGYALAKTLDTALLALLDSAVGSNYKVIGSDGNTAYAAGNEADLTDAGIRRIIRKLDDNNVPEEGRFAILPPSQKQALLGIDKFVLYQNVGRTTEIQKGLFGEIYGIKFHISTNCATTGSARVGCIGHGDALCCAVQQDVRIQSQQKLENLATLVVADHVYGVKALRVANDDTTGSNNRLSHVVAVYTP
jgi:N4-gp56 family major capsid protein